MAAAPPSTDSSLDHADTFFEGEFIPPKISTAHTPLPIGGYGSLEISADELILRGVKISTSNLMMGLLFFVAFSLVIVGGMTISLGAISIPFLVAGGAGLYFNYVLLRRKQKMPNGPETEIRIPLAKIKEMTRDGAHLGDGEITLLIADNKPQGMIHFYPAGSTPETATQAVGEAIERAVHPRSL